MSSNITNLLLIGLGPHAQRIYFPVNIKDGPTHNFKIIHGVDLKSKQGCIENYFTTKNYPKIEMTYLDDGEQSYEYLPLKLKQKLNKIVEEKNIKGVIISTEPLCHIPYARWALENNLSILMDKPISSYKDVSISPKITKKILTDYETLFNLYAKTKEKNPSPVFSLMAQRRYHPAFLKIKELLKEVFGETNCPVTSIQSFHSDGQWRMPTEIVDQDYHPYNQGYGKCSHSGYHSLDLVPWLLEATENKEKFINNVDVTANFMRPSDFIYQLNLTDYRKLFKDFDSHNKYQEKELNQIYKNFGEMDAFISAVFKHDDKVQTLGSINLVHNGFAQRNWVTAKGRDLYKGNGRVRHESHYIEQGPFQAISYISYQSKEVDPSNLTGLYDVGGEYHLDIHVFRNDKMFPKWKNYERITVKDLGVEIMEGKSRGHQEDARRASILEFVAALRGKVNKVESDYNSHRRSTALFYAAYQSAVNRLQNKDILVNVPF